MRTSDNCILIDKTFKYSDRYAQFFLEITIPLLIVIQFEHVYILELDSTTQYDKNKKNTRRM